MLLLLLLGVALAPSEQAAVKVETRPLPMHLQDQFFFRNLRYIPPPPPPGRDLKLNTVLELSMDQILDHFNPKDKRNWKQRYFARFDNFEDGGPAFIFIGGEAQENAPALQDYVLFVTYLAEQFKAKTFDLEHRYYGKSQPRADLSTANLQYLSADQALSDLAYFIEYLKDRGDIGKDQKVVVFGGSYPGNLAAWARYKFPHLINAAVSSSAPVHAKADFVDYMQVVGRSMTKKAGQFCYDNVKKATDRIVQLLKTTDGYQKVRDTFHVASELKAKVDLDSFFQTLSGRFAQAVQYNRDSQPDSDQNIRHVCSAMAGDKLTADEAMTKLANLVLGAAAAPGFYYDWSYRSAIAFYQNVEYTMDNTGNYNSARQWMYQTCSEFGFYQTYSGGDTPFPQGYNDIAFNYQRCKDVFGTDFGKDVLDVAVKRTNLIFGDLKPDVSNVIFVNGDIDPWHAIGILKNVSRKAPAIYIDGASHCADMDYPNYLTDSAEITAAHRTINDFVRNALYEKPDGDPAHC